MAEGGLILVVDDEPAVLDITAMTLEFAGFEILRAEDGRAAATLLEARGTELSALVLDTLCPSAEDAKDVLAALRKVHPTLPILLCSGRFEDESYESLDLPIGGGDLNCRFLQKPYEKGALEATVRELLRA